MTAFFSNQFAGSGISETSLPNPRTKAENHSRPIFRKIDFFTPTASTGDTVRLCSIGSHRTLLSLRAWWEPMSGNIMAATLALQGQEGNHDGALLEGPGGGTQYDLVCGSRAMNVVLVGNEILGTNTGAADADKIMLPLWGLANASDTASYSKDPQIDFDLVFVWEDVGLTPTPISLLLEYI